MTNATDQSPEVLEMSPEQASTNFYWLLGEHETFNLQTTIRGIVDPAHVAAHLESVKQTLTQVVKMKGRAKPIGQQPAPKPDPAHTGTIETRPVQPGPAPVQPTQSGGQREAHCVLIEIGTSYSGGKTQLKFTCDGLEHPLTYTKAAGDMVKLLAPLGYTADHLVVGKKYSADCTVIYTEDGRDGKTYKNVQKVLAR